MFSFCACCTNWWICAFSMSFYNQYYSCFKSFSCVIDCPRRKSSDHAIAQSFATRLYTKKPHRRDCRHGSGNGVQLGNCFASSFAVLALLSQIQKGDHHTIVPCKPQLPSGCFQIFSISGETGLPVQSFRHAQASGVLSPLMKTALRNPIHWIESFDS